MSMPAASTELSIRHQLRATKLQHKWVGAKEFADPREGSACMLLSVSNSSWLGWLGLG